MLMSLLTELANTGTNFWAINIPPLTKLKSRCSTRPESSLITREDQPPSLPKSLRSPKLDCQLFTVGLTMPPLIPDDSQ